MFLTVALFAAGIVLLIAGAELFVTASVSIAALARVPHILIGTTLVSLARMTVITIR